MLVAAALTAGVTGAAGGVSTTAGADARTVSPGSVAGPPYTFTTELLGDGVFIPLKDVGMLQRTKHGYRFRTGQQDSHLVVTRVDGGLRFVDTGTKSFKKVSPACHRQKVRVGVAAVCRVPSTISVRKPLLIEVWPRLGNDFTDTSSLSALFAVAVLGDKGRDVTRFGAGPDFFNGHSGRDPVRGGAGNDWIRAGLGNDPVDGGPGDDYIFGMEGRDELKGGSGQDRVAGADGYDRIRGNSGSDQVLCGTGRDRTKADRTDRIFHDCEIVDFI